MAVVNSGLGTDAERGFAFSNHDLIRELLARNPLAAHEFHIRFSARISSRVWRLLGTDVEHADIVQQVFVNIFEALNKLKNPEALDAWVDSIAIRTTRYELRRRGRRRALFLFKQEENNVEPRDETNPFKSHHVRQFYKIVDRMPTDDRVIFVLRFVEGCTVEQIASLGNYSVSTAKRRLKRAKATFEKSVLVDFSLVSLVEDFHAV